ncbi:MAG: TIGR02680 family protein [Burkholderiaceae bacterium]|jgi:uncharacterized protein (TIGR02680 family)|nr:TIGR02680 family protein [Burkholderiaceae bacterium]
MTETPPAALPEPRLSRWQPLRLGLVELFHYDSEEFWFRDGHLLLRGNNGTGKSKVLSLTLPLLFDAQLKPSRVEPDGDPGKKMAWNLLLGRHERRMGYAWVEFGRLGEDGRAHYLTLGCGLAAAAGRAQIDSWFFLLEQARIGQDMWLISPQRVVLTRERLRDALQAHAGRVFDTATAYRRAVDERLFHLGEARYAALMDTLIQLRQPQLSKKPDESSLSSALTEALPPMSTDLLTDVADALNQLEEYRRELEEYEALERAISQFNQRYRRYAAIQARRQSASLRGAQTSFDNASRELNQGKAELEQARGEHARASQAYQHAETALAASRTRVDTLQADPAMASARQLEQAGRDARQRQDEAQQAERARGEAQSRLAHEQQSSQERAQRVAATTHALTTARAETGQLTQQTGLTQAWQASPLGDAQAANIAALSALALETAQQDLRGAARARGEQVALLQRRCDDAEQAARERERAQSLHDERQDEAEAAAARRAESDAAVEQQAHALGEAWQRHLDNLRQLQVADAGALLEALAVWAASLQGENPARAALHQAQQTAAHTLAERHARLQHERRALDEEQAALQAERQRLERGEDAEPVPPHWRAAGVRADRPGAPLWQLIDFMPGTPDGERAGLEAALQAAGLLDAWVMPDGALRQAADGQPLHDTQWLARPSQPSSLAAWLRAADEGAAPPVAPAVVQRLLEGVACGPVDDGDAEAWMAPDGRFRLGALAGAWHKPGAEFIGYAARAAARMRRLREIAVRLDELARAQAAWRQALAQWEQDQRQAATEWQSAPADENLRTAHLQAAAAAREFTLARQRLEQAAQQLRSAAEHEASARQHLARDAQDMALPDTREALQALARTLQTLAETLPTLAASAREYRDAVTEQTGQQQREQRAFGDLQQASEQAAQRALQAEQAAMYWATLQESVGAQAQEILQRLAAARAAVEQGEAELKHCNEASHKAGQACARAEQKTEDAQAALEQRTVARQAAIVQLQGFAATGLLLAAWPDAELPPLNAPWTIEPALTLARRAEQALIDIKADDEAWSRVQSQVSQDYTELGRALATLSHQAQAETSDYGLVVSIVYQNRPERPDQLAPRLASEIAQRRELLTAGERGVLENHLQAEIASAVQRLLRDAEHQINAINTELQKRPTSTGVRFRLDWETLPEGAEGAPVGLAAARRQLLNASPDVWSAEDRRVIGAMLQQRIAAERSRADADQGGSLLEQLARALDYRRWHRFRVRRWQDGQWRPLIGPASSGERALGLTVPLFAAVSSFYSQADTAHAPRLVLLDEAFAGIDDAARAHCMGLIREFDLDFVITSEREWACYAELPGVAIAQLQRREGIDAVHVSRWTWDGRARRPETDPDRRFPPPE